MDFVQLLPGQNPTRLEGGKGEDVDFVGESDQTSAKEYSSRDGAAARKTPSLLCRGTQ